MKTIFLKVIIPAFSVIVTLTACERPCEDLWGLESSSMVIYPFDNATDEYIYLDNARPSLFDKDSLKVINEDGRQFPLVSLGLESDPRNRLNGFFAIHISPAFIIPDDNAAFSSEKTRKIYIQYNSTNADTLSLVFKAKKTKCDRSQYEYLKIFYKGQMVASVAEDIFIDFTLNR